LSEINRDTARHFIRGLGEDQEKAIRAYWPKFVPGTSRIQAWIPISYQPAHLDVLAARFSKIFPYIILYYIISYYIISYIIYHMIYHHIIYHISYHMSYHIISYYIILYYIILYYIILYYIILYYIISYCPSVSRLLTAGARVRSQSRM